LGAVGLLGIGTLAIACGSSTEEAPTSDTTSPILPDGAVNPAFDGSQPPVLDDGAVNPNFDGSQPPVLDDGAVNPNFDASSDSSTGTDASRDSSTTVDAGRDASTTPDSAVPPVGKVVGFNGIAAWDALAAVEKAKIKTGFRSLFLHQSVGGDLEDGAQAIGYKFEFFQVRSGTATDPVAMGLNGGLTLAGNGNGPGKVADLQRSAIGNKNTLRVAILKFGYADVVASNLATAQTAYLNGVNAIKAQGVRVLHVTPPFVFDVPAENAPKMQMRTWMMTTFPNDVIFDLEDAESIDPTNGSRCQRGGSWEICANVRSTSGCPSLNQGVDAPQGQGHLCYQQAQRITKAFLYSIYSAGK
jgi:hypothetical protein